MIVEESYIQYADGYIKRDVTPLDIQKAIKDIQDPNKNIQAFWVGIWEEDHDELVMETTENLQISINFGTGESIKIVKAKNWEEAEQLYDYIMKGDMEGLKAAIS